MNLSEIITKKFLPPLLKHYGDDAKFEVEKSGDKFIPKLISDRAYYAYYNDYDGIITGNAGQSSRTLLDTKEAAYKMCWRFFKDAYYLKPKEGMANESN